MSKTASGLSLKTLRGELAEVTEPAEAVDLANKAEAIRRYMKKAGAKYDELEPIAFARVEAFHHAALLLPPEEQMPTQGARSDLSSTGQVTWASLGLGRQLGGRLRLLGLLTVDELKDWRKELKAQIEEPRKEPTLARALQIAARKRNPELFNVKPPKGTYSTIVIDPPWPVGKIEREERPTQGQALDYPVKNLEELEVWLGGLIGPICPPDAHIYLWATQKTLPTAIDMPGLWDLDLNYQCLLTWIKNVGFTPYSWMYSTEHIIFAHRGKLDLLAKGRRLDFAAKVREHSRKPDEFYDLVRDVSPGPRLDMFARGSHVGFDSWGNETDRFVADA